MASTKSTKSGVVAKNQLKIETVIVCGNDWLDQ
jgi:hypothetical protein